MLIFALKRIHASMAQCINTAGNLLLKEDSAMARHSDITGRYVYVDVRA